MRILIAGSTGLVGSAIFNKFTSMGLKPIGISSKELDLRNYSRTLNFVRKTEPTVIINAAAKVGGINANRNNPVDFLLDNLKIQNNLIEAAHLCNVERFIFLGSSCIYPKYSQQPMKEEYLFSGKLEKTNSAYAIAKLCGIELINSFQTQYGREWINLIPTSVYGPKDNFDEDKGHVIPSLISKLSDAVKRKKKEITLFGTGSPKREFIHSDDLASAIYVCLENYKSNEPINIGTGFELSIKEIAELISEIMGYSGSIHWDESWPDGTPRKLLDSSKIMSLGWSPSITLDIGLRSTINWYEENVQSLKG